MSLKSCIRLLDLIRDIADKGHKIIGYSVGDIQPCIQHISIRRGLLPAGWQETFRSAASRLALTQKSPASRLTADLNVS